jgi:exopolysaccharide biosynthesis polyprenyl glycosylphosphotransferase
MAMIAEIISGYPVKIRIVPDLGTFSYKSAELITFGSLPVLQIHPGPLSYWYNRIIKRLFDLLISLFITVFILSWMTFLLSLISWISNGDGVFFRQRRTCIDGREFSCIKFRTMKKNAEADLRQATKNDERITPVGKFLRKYSLDELPQFINVLLDDMSVVGPRPHMLAHTAQYRQLISHFMLRHTVKPGITGLAQVNGYRGEIKNLTDLSKRVGQDVQYIETWSFNLDLKIILLTLWALILGQKEAY